MNIRRLPFLDVFADESGGNIKTPQGEYKKCGQFPVIDQGKSLVAGYVDDKSRLCGSGRPAIVFGDHTRCFKYIDFPFCMGADGVKILRPKIEADLKYLFYYLRQLNLSDAGYNRHFKYLKWAEVVLLPLPEQRRIAAILDQADALRAKRREALAQLDSLTHSIFIEMFGDPATNPKGWKIVPLGEILDGLTDYHANGSYEVLRSHVDLLDTPDFALMLRTTDLENNDFSTGVKYITESAYNFFKKSQVFGGEIIINKIGSAGNVYLAPSLNRPVSLGMNSFLLRINKCANSRFIYDVLTSDYIGGIIRSKVRGVVTKTITKEAVGRSRYRGEKPLHRLIY